MINDEQIKQLAVNRGFKLSNDAGNDLKPYVYEFARDLIALAQQSSAGLLDTLQDMAYQHCHTDKNKETDSGAISANADALRILADNGKFRILREYGRMVVGYWPENDPQKLEAGK